MRNKTHIGFIISNASPGGDVYHLSDEDEGEAQDDDVVMSKPEPATPPWYTLPLFCLPGTKLLDMHNFHCNLAFFWVDRILECGTYFGEWTSFPVDYKLASYCTGTGTGEMTHGEGVDAMSQHLGFPTVPRVVTMGEKEKFKQRWLIDNGLAKKGTHLYDDVGLVKDGKANCVVDGKCCSLASTPRPHNFKSGFSCKLFSKANGKFSEFRTAIQDPNGGSSVRTFLASLDYISETCPDTWTLENVDSIGEEEEETSNLARCLAALREMNDSMYKIVHVLVTSSEFGLPQSRPPVVLE
jgi:hypothetical protein